MKAIKTILLVDDEQYETEALIRQLGSDYELHAAINDEALAHELFAQVRPELLILSLRSVSDAERFYLKLVRMHPDNRLAPHQVILFCLHKEAAQAADLCLHGAVDDYVISRPFYDIERFQVAVYHAEIRLQARLALKESTGRLAEAASGYAVLGQLPDESAQRVSQARSEADLSQQRILQEMDQDFERLSQRLAAEQTDTSNRTHLTRELLQFNEQQVRPRFEQQRTEITKPYEHWAGEIHDRVSTLVQTGRQVTAPPRKSILVVDDDAVLRYQLGELLEDEGFQVSAAENATEALRLLGQSRPDAILLDYRMPDLDGITLLQQVRSEERLKHIPVLMLTGHSERQVVAESLKAGADDFLVKPVDPAVLQKKLQQHLGRA